MSGMVINARDAFFTKDPDAVLDYVLDMQPFLADGDTLKITPLTVTASGVTLDSYSVNQAPITVTDKSGVREIPAFKAVVLWLSEGALGTTGAVTTRFSTNYGRLSDVTFRVAIKSK